MTRRMIFEWMAPALAVLALSASSALASNAKTVDLWYAASVGNAKLGPGNYKVAWTNQTPETRLTISNGKRIVAQVDAKWVDRKNVHKGTSVVYKTAPDGSRSVTEIQFAGMSQALVISAAPRGSEGSSSSGL